MKKINYPKEWKKHYWACFTKEQKIDLQKKWTLCKKQNPELSKFPRKIRKILCANFKKLTNWYFLYIKIVPPKNEYIKNELKLVFNYDKYRSLIGDYFKLNFNITSCFYCDIHIIGKYEAINNNEIEIYRTFDNDHFYENDQCPLLALSVQNFVPSCQVCNERIKHKKNFLNFYHLFLPPMTEQRIKEIIYKISPISDTAEFNENISIHVIPQPGFSNNMSYLKNLNSYKIKFDATNAYLHHTKAFRLEERYNSISILSEALSILELKRKFPPSKILEIKKIFQEQGKPVIEEQIEEIIFRKKYDENRHSNLMKLKQDLLE